MGGDSAELMLHSPVSCFYTASKRAAITRPCQPKRTRTTASGINQDMASVLYCSTLDGGAVTVLIRYMTAAGERMLQTRPE